MQTRAVVIPEPNRVELQDVTLKALGPADVLIQTAYTSISAGTERMLLGGQMPHPMLQLPVIPGYETVGRVIERGPDADPALQDQWVYIGGAMCYEGINGAWGGQSARIISDHKRVIPLNDVEPRHGVLLALMATALHGVDLLSQLEGSRVLIIGQGPVGQLAARFAKLRGAEVIVTDRNPQRLQRAHADHLINVDDTPLAETLSQPVTAIIEASGSMPALTEALPHLATGGTILLLGYYQTLEIPYMPLFLKEARLLTAKEWASGDLMRCRDHLAAGEIDAENLLTHELSVLNIAEAYEVAMSDPTCLKLVIDWRALSEGAGS